MTNPTFTIATSKLGQLRQAISKLARKATKLNVPVPTIEIVGNTGTHSHTNTLGCTVFYEVVTVEILSTEVKLPGFKALGIIHLDRTGGNNNIVNVIDGATAEPRWRTLGDTCEHCDRRNLGRKKLIAVENTDTGKRLAVGTTCAKDYLGHPNPTALAAYLEAIGNFVAEINEEIYDRPNSKEVLVDPISFLIAVAGLIAVEGYISGAAANKLDRRSTAIQAWEYCQGIGIADWRSPIDEATNGNKDKWELEADLAIEFAQTIEGHSDFAENIRSIANREAWDWNCKGYAAWILDGYRTSLADKAQAENAPQSNFIGEIKERLVITAEIVYEKWFDNQYGGKTLYKGITTDGDNVTWWCSGEHCPEKGDTITGKATVRKHETYKGTKATVVQRWTWDHVNSEN